MKHANLVGVAGLCIEIVWVLPKGLFLLILPGFAAYAVMVLLSIGIGFGISRTFASVEGRILRRARIGEASPAILGSQVLWMVLPLVAIPIHMVFPRGIFLSGHVEISILIAAFFTCWHGACLRSLLQRTTREATPAMLDPGTLITRQIVVISIFEFIVAIACYVVTTLVFSFAFPQSISLWML
jgi:hypothetical protein